MGTQETIIYRLAMRTPSYNAYFSFLISWATFGIGGKMGVAITRAHNSQGSPNPAKKLAHCVDHPFPLKLQHDVNFRNKVDQAWHS